MPSLFSIGNGKSTGRTQSIDELKSLISSKGGLANPTLYRVFLPKSPGNFYKVDTPELNMLASSVTLPGRQIMTQEREIGGVVQKVANNSATADVNMTFRVLNNYGVRRYFESWQNMAVAQGDTHAGSRQEIALQYSTDYCFDVKIQQLKKGFGIPIYNTALPMPKLPTEIQNRLPKIDTLGEALGSIDLAQGELDLDFMAGDQVVYECTLMGAFCTTMNAIELTDASNNQILELNVSLSYRRWVPSGDTSNRDALGSAFNTLGLPDIRKAIGL